MYLGSLRNAVWRAHFFLPCRRISGVLEISGSCAAPGTPNNRRPWKEMKKGPPHSVSY
ncbi:unnamed protein product [Ectocarpus sp. CCAP 1310/34]|nr:unnamed protein product [Ectocarpus sp. CCAP 1310/34]